MSTDPPIHLHHAAWVTAALAVVLWVPLGLLSLGVLVIAPVVLGGYGSGHEPSVVTVYMSIYLFPGLALSSIVFSLVSAGSAHFFASRGRRRGARIALGLTLASAALPILSVLGAAIGWAFLPDFGLPYPHS